MTLPSWTSLRRVAERMVYSEVNYWAGMCCDLLGAFAFLVIGLAWFSGPALVAVGAAVAGFLLWGFLEYALHRWVLHGPPSMARTGHARHHASPLELFSTPLFVIPLAAGGIWVLLSLLISHGTAAFTVFGLYLGYNSFAGVHHLQHHQSDSLARVPWLGRLQHFHESHHHRQVVNFGISTTLWDRLFGTFRAADEVVTASGARSNRSEADRREGPARRAANRTPS